MRWVAQHNSLIDTLVKIYALQLNFYYSCNMSFDININKIPLLVIPQHCTQNVQCLLFRMCETTPYYCNIRLIFFNDQLNFFILILYCGLGVIFFWICVKSNFSPFWLKWRCFMLLKFVTFFFSVLIKFEKKNNLFLLLQI